MKQSRAASAAPRQAADGTWWFVVDVGVGADGQRRQTRRRGFRTKKLAQEELDKVRRTVTQTRYVPPARETFGEYLDRWLAGLPTRLRPSTCDGYRRCLQYVTPGLRSRRLDHVTADNLDQLYAALLVSGRRQREGGLSPRSVRYVHSVIRKALADAVRKGALARNVADSASPPLAKSTRAPEMAWWKPRELRTFLDQTAGEPLGPLFRVAAMTGMRRGEVCGIRWSDLDLDKARIQVRQQLNVVRSPGAPDGGLVFSERTKTDRGRRVVDLDPGTVAVLKARRRQQAEHRLAVGAGWANEHDLVFTEADGRPLDPESVSQVFNRRVARSGLPRIRFHDLRHTHCAHLIEAGEQLLLITRRLGHASVAFTQDRYGHLFEEAGSQAASAVAAMVDHA
ncbi:MAG: tyrosine-type recombinase/integrase [Acidimicrobiales bacterium]|jgi:integrase